MTTRTTDQTETLFEAPTATKPQPEKTDPSQKAAKASKNKKAAKEKKSDGGRELTAASQQDGHVVNAYPPGSPEAMLAGIAAAAADPRVDVGKMTALNEMRRQIVAERAQQEFVADFIAMSGELPPIRADGKIEIREKVQGQGRVGKVQQATPYATYENIMKVVGPILKRHGFALTCATEPGPDMSRLIVRGYLMHKGGHQTTTAFPLPIEDSGSKNSVQGWGSTQKYGRRYVAIALLNIVSYAKEDRDLDGHHPDNVVESEALISDDEVAALRTKIESSGVGEDKFCQKYGIKKIEHLPAALYDEAGAACLAYGRERAQREKV